MRNDCAYENLGKKEMGCSLSSHLSQGQRIHLAEVILGFWFIDKYLPSGDTM